MTAYACSKYFGIQWCFGVHIWDVETRSSYCQNELVQVPQGQVVESNGFQKSKSFYLAQNLLTGFKDTFTATQYLKKVDLYAYIMSGDHIQKCLNKELRKYHISKYTNFNEQESYQLYFEHGT